jgi:integrase/recombinase XerD
MKKDYETILADFLKWLDTLGYAATLIHKSKLSTHPFLKWLESKQIYNINQLTDRHITEYHACLETRPNKIYKGQTLGVAYLNKTFIALDKFLEFLRQYGIKNAPAPTNYRILKPKQERKKNETLMNTSYRAILDEYAVWLDTLGYSESVVIYGKRYTDFFFRWLENRQIQSIRQLTNKHITEYHAYLETRPNWKYKGRMLSIAQLNHNFWNTDKLLEFLHQYGVNNAPIPTNRRMEVDKEARILKIETLTQTEIKTLFACIPETYQNLPFVERQEKQAELRVIFALFYGCGLRRSEGHKLRLKDIDFDRKTVFVEQGKNYKDRIIPMSAGVYKELQEFVYNYLHKIKTQNNRLFNCDRATLGNKLKYLQSVCNDEQIKAKRLSLHVLRHSIATHLLQNGMSIENIALFLGHSNLDTTQIYTHLIL